MRTGSMDSAQDLRSSLNFPLPCLHAFPVWRLSVWRGREEGEEGRGGPDGPGRAGRCQDRPGVPGDSGRVGWVGGRV
jgi:hypothetical protein